MNKVVIIGRLTKDPELRFAAGTGNGVCRFTVAVNRFKKKDEEKAQADFISCVAFGKTAEAISQYFTIGRQIAISGSIRTGSYDSQDGSKRYTTDVAVETFNFLDSQSNQGNNLEQPNEDITPVNDGEMPF